MADDLPDEAWLAALSSLPGCGPARLRVLLARWSPADAWAQVLRGGLLGDEQVADHLRGDPRRLVAGWREAARALDPADVWAGHLEAGVSVLGPGSAAWPGCFVDDPEPPAVLFTVGDVAVARSPAVAVVGTRRCTRYGHDVARRLGRELAEAGVGVVSGLALGIDEAAHRGALEVGHARVVGVVGTGTDVPYPRRNADLWHEVGERGTLLTEAPLGTTAEAWRFPARNRLIAALADLTVVVESHVEGGSLYTVDEALARDRPVLAVPGPIRSPASAGTNRLLAEGAVPLCGTDDVLGLLDLTSGSPAPIGPSGGDASPSADLGGDGRAVLDAMGWEPTSLDDLVGATGLDLGAVSVALTHLEADGHVARRGAWYERVDAR